MVMAPVARTPPPPAPLPAAVPSASRTTRKAAKVAVPSFPLAALDPDIVPLEVSELADVGLDFDGPDGGVEGGVPGGVEGGLVGGLGEPPVPSQPADEPTIYVVSGELSRPDKIVHVDPLYPALASVARVEGLVILEATIDGRGNVENLRVLLSVPLLDRAAVEAVRQWKYEPTVIAGTPVPILMTVTVKFALT